MSNYELHHGDCLEVMRDIPDGSIDCVATDIPYGISQASGGLKGKELDFGEWDKFSDDELFTLNQILDRIVRHSVVMFCSDTQMSDIIKFFKTAGWLVRQLVWFKPNAFGMNANVQYIWSTENAVFAKRPSTKFNGKNKRNMFTYPTTRNKVHPTQKPVDLMRELITDATDVDSTILDPFMGSGTTGVACLLENRKFIGIEKDAGYFEIAKNRIAEVETREPLFV